tara:strand:+ start:2887 stop:3726 length:840 start_codon:yes stop_codon:yes gene_type:complete
MAFIENYSVNDTTLDSHKYAIETVRKTSGKLKGENSVPAFDHGQRWTVKHLDIYSERWDMYVTDNDATTGIPPATVEAQRASLNANYEELMGILQTTHLGGGYEAPLKVVRKEKSNPGSPADVYRVNYAEIKQPMEVSKSSTFDCYRFTAQVDYMDPRWYESNSGGTKTSSTLTASGNPGGTAVMTRMVITLDGDDSTSNPFIQNTTTGSKLTWSGGDPSGDITINTRSCAATIGGNSVTGNIDRTGSTTSAWFELRPGVTNTLVSNVSYSIAYTKAFL